MPWYSLPKSGVRYFTNGKAPQGARLLPDEVVEPSQDGEAVDPEVTGDELGTQGNETFDGPVDPLTFVAETDSNDAGFGKEPSHEEADDS